MVAFFQLQGKVAEIIEVFRRLVMCGSVCGVVNLSIGTEIESWPVDLDEDLWRASFTSCSVTGRMEK